MLNLDPVSERNNGSIQKIESSERILLGLCFCMNHGLNDQNQFDLMLEAVEYADRSGFHFAWVVDEYFHDSTGVKLNPAIFHSAISVLTSQIELRGECLAPARRDAIRTVEDWSIIDNLSNGRVGILVPFGFEEPAFGSLFVEHVNELRGLWKGNSVRRINGVGSEVELKIFPKPIQEELPIWVPMADTSCEINFRKAGELGLNLLTTTVNKNHQQWLSNIERYRNAVSLSKYTQRQGKVTVLVDLYGEEDCQVKRAEGESFTRSLSMMYSGINSLELDEKGCSKVSESEFIKFYDNISKANSGIDEIAFKIDLTRGKESVFNHLKRLEKSFESSNVS